MTNILFILFQGGATNLKHWNEHTESKFLDKLKEVGSVYMYQDKTMNIYHYYKKFNDYNDYDSDIDFNLSYIKPNTHIEIIYNNICKKYKNINEYKFIPIGYSLGSGLALLFSQKYKSQCIHCILLDPIYITPKNVPSQIIQLYNKKITYTNSHLQKMLYDLKNNYTEENFIKLEHFIDYIKFLNYSKKIKLIFKVKTTSFINIDELAKYSWQKDNNNNRLYEIKILQKMNPENYIPIIFINKTHMIYDKKQPANKIIKYITNIIRDYKKIEIK